jgi:hypothetical protein
MLAPDDRCIGQNGSHRVETGSLLTAPSRADSDYVTTRPTPAAPSMAGGELLAPAVLSATLAETGSERIDYRLIAEPAAWRPTHRPEICPARIGRWDGGLMGQIPRVGATSPAIADRQSGAGLAPHQRPSSPHSLLSREAA